MTAFCMCIRRMEQGRDRCTRCLAGRCMHLAPIIMLVRGQVGALEPLGKSTWRFTASAAPAPLTDMHAVSPFPAWFHRKTP